MSFVVHPAHREPHCYWKGWVDRSVTTPKWSDRLQALRQQRQPALSLHTLGAMVATSLNESAILELDCIIYIVQIAVYLDDIPFTKGYYCPVVSELAFHVLIPAPKHFFNVKLQLRVINLRYLSFETPDSIAPDPLLQTNTLRSNVRLASVREPNQGIKIPITATSPTDVCVTPDTNRPGGTDSIPKLST